VNLLRDDIDTIKKNTETLIDASKEIDLEINIEKTILREVHRLRVFENRVLTRIFGPKRGEMTGGWRKLHNEELHQV
jgi:hypothetical protein